MIKCRDLDIVCNDRYLFMNQIFDCIKGSRRRIDEDCITIFDKGSSLFFTLAAKNPDEHMTNIANLSDLLMTDGVIEALDKITTISDFESLLQT